MKRKARLLIAVWRWIEWESSGFVFWVNENEWLNKKAKKNWHQRHTYRQEKKKQEKKSVEKERKSKRKKKSNENTMKTKETSNVTKAKRLVSKKQNSTSCSNKRFHCCLVDICARLFCFIESEILCSNLRSIEIVDQKERYWSMITTVIIYSQKPDGKRSIRQKRKKTIRKMLVSTTDWRLNSTELLFICVFRCVDYLSFRLIVYIECLLASEQWHHCRRKKIHQHCYIEMFEIDLVSLAFSVG